MSATDPVLDRDKLRTLLGSYASGNAQECLSDPSILRDVRMRRRQLGRMTMALDIDTAKHRLPEDQFHISLKIDGEFTCLYWNEGEIFTINPGGTVRTGAPFLDEAKTALQQAGIARALIGGELYALSDGSRRPWVHDIVRIARAPTNNAELDRLAMGFFNIYEIDGKDPSMHYGEAFRTLQKLFGEGQRAHPVETIIGDRDQVFKQFNTWVLDNGEEGVVVRSDNAGTFKIKQRHNLDLAVIGFSEGIDDRAGMLHSLLLGVVRNDGTFQVCGRVGGGFKDEQRRQLLNQLRDQGVESEYVEVNSDRVAYQMLEPGLVCEINCLDLVSRTSHGNTIDQMIIEWDHEARCWRGIRRLPLASIISPQFVRLRDDKTANAEEVKLSQFSDITDIPEIDRTADQLQLPKSTLLERRVATKAVKDSLMVRKVLLWKTNKEDTGPEYPAWVVHLTDYSPNRKEPLSHDIRVSDSESQIRKLFDEMIESSFVRGWNELETPGPSSQSLPIADAANAETTKPIDADSPAEANPINAAPPSNGPSTANQNPPTQGSVLKQSATKKSATKKSTTKKSTTKKSTAKKSTAKKSTTKKSTAKKSTAKKSTAKKSTAKKSTTKKSTAKKSTTKKSTAKKSTAKKSATKKSTAKKSTAKKSTTKKSTPTQSTRAAKRGSQD